MFFWTIVVVLGLPVIALAGYYTVFALAKADIFWTIVKEGWCKIVLARGHYWKTVGPGWHWIGLPGIYSLYKRTMTFMKSVIKEDGTAKAIPHNDEDISSFKTTRYPYALPYKDQEDKNALHLSGIITVHGTLVDYGLAFFKASDWYAEMNSHVMKVWRDDVLPNISFDEDIVKRTNGTVTTTTATTAAKKAISALLWEKLNEKPAGSESVVEKMRKTIGFQAHEVDLVSVDPPPDWRATTLAPYKAMKEKEAAKHQAETSALLFDDTNQALRAWLKDHPLATLDQIDAKQKELEARAKLKLPGYQELHVKGLEGATTAVVGGSGVGGAGILVGNSGRGQNSGGSGAKGKKKPKPSKDEDDDDDELETSMGRSNAELDEEERRSK